MKLKTRVEMIFLGIVVMATIAAIFAMSVAAYQVLSSDDFAYPQEPFGKIEDTFDLSKQRPSPLMQNGPTLETENSHKAFNEARITLKNMRGFEDQVHAHDLLMKVVTSNSKERAEAAYELGKIYRLALTKDCQEAAFEWFVKSAEWGYRKAHLEIAKSFKRGVGVDADIDQAIHHYKIASDNGSAAGALELIELLMKGGKKPAGIDRPGDKILAKKALKAYLPLLEEAAQNGNGRAARSIARLYQSGELIQQDLAVAESWFEYAANADDAAAMHDLALLKLGKSDGSEKPLELLKTSAKKGYSAAMTALGRFYLRQQNSETKQVAVNWLEQGAAAGHAGAMEELAHLYFEGLIVDKNIEKARDYATRGAQQKHTGAIKALQNIELSINGELASKE